MLNSLNNNIILVLLGALASPVFVIIIKLFGKIISEKKVIRDTKMLDLESIGLIYLLKVFTFFSFALILFLLLINFVSISGLIVYISIAVLFSVFFIFNFNLLSINDNGFNKIEELFNNELVKKDEKIIDKDLKKEMSTSFKSFILFIKKVNNYYSLLSFLNFFSCLVILKYFGFWGIASAIICITNIITLVCLDAHKQGEIAFCDIYFKNNNLLSNIKTICINDSDVYLEIDNELKIISRSEILEIIVKKIEKNINKKNV